MVFPKNGDYGQKGQKFTDKSPKNDDLSVKFEWNPGAQTRIRKNTCHHSTDFNHYGVYTKWCWWWFFNTIFCIHKISSQCYKIKLYQCSWIYHSHLRFRQPSTGQSRGARDRDKVWNRSLSPRAPGLLERQGEPAKWEYLGGTGCEVKPS